MTLGYCLITVKILAEQCSFLEPLGQDSFPCCCRLTFQLPCWLCEGPSRSQRPPPFPGCGFPPSIPKAHNSRSRPFGTSSISFFLFCLISLTYLLFSSYILKGSCDQIGPVWIISPSQYHQKILIITESPFCFIRKLGDEEGERAATSLEGYYSACQQGLLSRESRKPSVSVDIAVESLHLSNINFCLLCARHCNRPWGYCHEKR